MKTLELSFPSGTYLMVELPEDTVMFNRRTCDNEGGTRIEAHLRGGKVVRSEFTISCYDKLIGLLSDLKEEDFAETVPNNGMGCYDNYKGIPDNRYTLISAKESFESAVEAAGWYLENPYSDNPIPGDHPDLGVADAQWQAAQEKTFDPSRTYLFREA